MYYTILAKSYMIHRFLILNACCAVIGLVSKARK